MEVMKIGNDTVPAYKVIENAISGAGWFRVIAAFSVINTLLIVFKSDLNFVIGLGATAVIDYAAEGIRQEAGRTASMIVWAIQLCINLGFVGMFLLFWHYSKKGKPWVYMTGMILYALDRMIFMALGDMLGFGFHCYFLFCMFGGFRYIKYVKEAEALMKKEAQEIAEKTEEEIDESSVFDVKKNILAESEMVD